MARKSITHMQCIIKFLQKRLAKGKCLTTLYTGKYHGCIEYSSYELRVRDRERRGVNTPAVQVMI